MSNVNAKWFSRNARVAEKWNKIEPPNFFHFENKKKFFLIENDDNQRWCQGGLQVSKKLNYFLTKKMLHKNSQHAIKGDLMNFSLLTFELAVCTMNSTSYMTRHTQCDMDSTTSLSLSCCSTEKKFIERQIHHKLSWHERRHQRCHPRNN